MALETYKKKRNFRETSEPQGALSADNKQRFVVQEHHASRLHFDLRLEMGGVLKSWAVPKGPSLNPKDKRLAVMTEDHPVDYLTFEGHIAEGNYGAGDMAIWDTGTYDLLEGGDPEAGVESGKLVLDFHGEKMAGEFHMVRMDREDGRQWLLMKTRDGSADPNWRLQQVLDDGGRRVEPAASSPSKGKESRGNGHKAGKALSESVEIAGAKKAKMPERISPMLATLVDKPFSDPGWLFELKWDGYRAICFIKGGKASFVSRNNIDLTHRFPALASVRDQVDANDAILDGEIVAVDKDGIPSFQLLQNSAVTARGNKGPSASVPEDSHLVYYVFDLLYWNGLDLRAAALRDRKLRLKSILKPGPRAMFSDHVSGEGQKLFDHAAKAGLEGIVAKRADSEYVEKRSSSWLKMKTVKRQEAVIGGYTDPRKTRPYFGALVVGLYKDDELHYVGHTGSGFGRKSLQQLYDRMKPLETATCPFVEEPKTNEPVHWIKPDLVCEVKFHEWTSENIMRQPIFMGLREDKAPKDCTFETEHPANVLRAKAATASDGAAPDQSKARKTFDPAKVTGDLWLKLGKHKVNLTSLDKLYWPDDGYTKADLLKYYQNVADVILPHLKDRPVILKRHPDGIDGESFFQHNIQDAPEFLDIYDRRESKRLVHYAVVNNAAALLYVANLGAIAQNAFHSTVQHISNPDWIVFDLDPDGVSFPQVCEVALAVRDTLAEVGLQGYAKTSGSRGIHVLVGLRPVYSYAQSYSFCELVCRLIGKRMPKLVTVERITGKRGRGKVYLDWMQNVEGKTIATAYSVRACPKATVSAPLEWDEVAAGPVPQDFTMKNMPDRIDSKGDLFAAVLSKRQKLEDAIAELEKMVKSAGVGASGRS